MTYLLRATESGEILDREGKVVGRVVPVEPSRSLVDKGAQAIAHWSEHSTWPESWDELQVRQMRQDARKAYRAMLSAATLDIAALAVPIRSEYKAGNEMARYHPDASHIEPGFRDGWNACLDALEGK